MAGTYPLVIATPHARLFDGPASAVRVRAVDGELGVMASHAPMVAELTIGEMMVTEPSGEETYFATSGGVLRVEEDGVVIISDGCEAGCDIDVHRAQQAIERARGRLRAGVVGRDTDVARAELALGRALNRLHVAGHQSL
jgi:F-type H+-transporting ATPase subunit epsilon